MQTQKYSLFFKVFSLAVIFSLLLAACAPGNFLSGTGGEESTQEVPQTEEVQTEEPETEEPETEEPETQEVETQESETEVVSTEDSLDEPLSTEESTEATATDSIDVTATPEPPTSTLDPDFVATETPDPNATPTLTETPSPTPTVTLTPTEQGGRVSGLSEGNDPYIGLSVQCNNDLSATFTITNAGGDLSGGSYSVSEPNAGTANHSLDLGSGDSISFNAAGNATVTVSYSTSQLDNVNLKAVGTCLPLPSNTPIPSSTSTRTPTITRTPTLTRTPTSTRTPTLTRTPTTTVTAGPSPTASVTSTSTPTRTPTVSRTPTFTRTPTTTVTAGPSPTASVTATRTPTRTPTSTRTPRPSRTPTTTVTEGPSPTASVTRTSTLTRTPTITRTPTFTRTPSLTPTITATRQILDGQLDLQVFCNTDLSATFVIRNISGAVSNGTYNLSADTSGAAQNGSINLQPGDSMSIRGAGYATMDVTYSTDTLSSVFLSVTGSCTLRPPTATSTNTPLATATFTATPTATATLTSTPTSTPITPPALSVVGACSNVNTGTATFVITNSGGAMTTSYTYDITDATGTVVDSNTFQLGANQSETITYSGSSTSYSYTFSSPNDNSLTTTADMTPCVPPPPPPALSVIGACSSPTTGGATFVITNNGGAMTAPYTYNITDATGAVVETKTFQLGANQSETITYSGSSTSYTLTSPNDASLNAVADLTTCVQAPSLTISGACTSNAGEAEFVITNNGGNMPSPSNYEITDANGTVVQNGTFQVLANQSVKFTIKGGSASYTFTNLDDPTLTATADMTVCGGIVINTPSLSATGACTSNADIATFVITNTGGDMTMPYDYEITDASGAVVQTASFQLISGQSITIVVNNATSSSYTLSSPHDPGLTAQADMTTCVTPPPPPALSATGVCAKARTAGFNITNNGGDMTVAYLYEVTDSSGNVIQSGSIQLNAGQSLNLSVVGDYDELILLIMDANNTTARAALANCYESLSVGAAEPNICIECLVFHTFRDNDLEVYRLDGIEGQEGFRLYNLSKDAAVDSRPSRSPNDSWVVFQSNRNGNVELYYTDLAGSGEAIRLTNSQLNNTNPMYGPDSQTVVFQSDRNGRFDLFTIDQSTGKETQITSNPADDINPFYSPDLKFLVFQSYRNNNWDLYVLNVETGTEYQLTNSLTDETFPAWSPNGKQIAFLSNENGATDLYVIDLDTGEIERITVDGKTNNPVWSPEGDRIAYQSERNGNLDIYSYDFNENKEYRVTDYEGIDSGPTWDCGGTNLAFTSMRDGDANIFQVFWQGGGASNMTIDPATDKWSQWRPSNDVSSTGY